MQSDKDRLADDKLADAVARIAANYYNSGYSPRVIDVAQGPNRKQRREQERLRKQGKKK